MTTALANPEPTIGDITRVLILGDLARLSDVQRADYYTRVCDSLGLNPLTRPFDYITLNGKLTLYARKDATEQLRSLRGVSIQIVAREMVDDVYVVTARATTREGRTDESIGAVTVGNLKGEAKANAMMKAETKAKRRITLSICGLGLLDEMEVETIPGATPVVNVTPPAEPPAPKKQRATALADKTAANSPPTTGAELLVRVRAADTMLAAQKLIQPGELLDHVRLEGVAAGHDEDMLLWSGPAIELAMKVAREFKAKLAERHPPEPEPTAPAPQTTTAEKMTPHEERQLLEAIHSFGKNWMDTKFRAWVCETIGITLQVNDHISILSREQGQKLIEELRAIKARSEARRTKKAGAA